MTRSIASLTVLVAIAGAATVSTYSACAWAAEPAAQDQVKPGSLPRLLDLGAKECIPCKLMWPILEQMKKEFAGKLQVEFIDVGQKDNASLAKQYDTKLIPTQIFFDAAGKELWRHEGFLSRYSILDKWRELKYEFAEKALAPAFSRMEPAQRDQRPRERICFMCDGDIDPRTRVVVKSEKGEVGLCSPHCYFIMYSCLTEDKAGFETRVFVTDWAAGKLIRATSALYLYGLDEKTGRHTTKAFADQEGALRERQSSGGSLVGWPVLQNNELACRCGFCDRTVYPEDAALVRADGLYTWGCCCMCAMGVAARTGKDIEVHEKDRLTGEKIVVKTLGGSIASVEPATAVAWFSLKRNAEGQWVSAGCFHKGFFVNEANLRKWLEQHPYEVGKMISIDQALGDKMKLSPAQISKACKIGECSPK
jgi:thioredoxin 1